MLRSVSLLTLTVGLLAGLSSAHAEPYTFTSDLHFTPESSTGPISVFMLEGIAQRLGDESSHPPFNQLRVTEVDLMIRARPGRIGATVKFVCITESGATRSVRTMAELSAPSTSEFSLIQFRNRDLDPENNLTCQSLKYNADEIDVKPDYTVFGEEVGFAPPPPPTPPRCSPVRGICIGDQVFAAEDHSYRSNVLSILPDGMVYMQNTSSQGFFTINEMSVEVTKGCYRQPDLCIGSQILGPGHHNPSEVVAFDGQGRMRVHHIRLDKIFFFNANEVMPFNDTLP